MAESCSSSNVKPTPVLDEIFDVSGKEDIPSAMKFFLDQLVTEEEMEGEYLAKKIGQVKETLKRVRKAIGEIESMRPKEDWVDTLECFNDNKKRLELKLSRLTRYEYENSVGIGELKVHSAVMELD